jgi:hypothetical protein
MYIIKYLEDKSLFFVEIFNKINHSQIIGFLNTICETQVINKSILLITDYRNAIIDETSIEPIEKIGLFVNSKMKNTFVQIKWANISINYLPTTGALLLHDYIKGKGIEYQPFTTIEMVLAWMNLTSDDLNRLKILAENH